MFLTINCYIDYTILYVIKQRYYNMMLGIDMEASKEGGTWLALSTKGKAAVILNFVGKEAVMDASKKSRGFLIRDFITSNDSMELYLDKLHKENVNKQPYNPYCLVLLDLKYVNNIGNLDMLIQNDYNF